MYVVLTVMYTVVLKERLKKIYTTDKKRSKNTCTAGKEFNSKYNDVTYSYYRTKLNCKLKYKQKRLCMVK